MENAPLPGEESTPPPGQGTEPEVPATRPTLKLAPRSAAAAAARTGSGSSKSNPFGAAKPREEVLSRKGVDVNEVEKKIEAKVAVSKSVRLTKAQQEEVDALQLEIDTAATELAATMSEEAKASITATLTSKKSSLDDLLEKFKSLAVAAKVEKPVEPRKFERPSERRARLEAEGGGGGGGGGGGARGYGEERQGDFSSFGSRGGGRGAERRPGDWPCPACSANNFASRNSCFKCNEPRAGGDGGGYGGGGGYERQGDFSSFSSGRGGGGGGGYESRPGDWPCPSCSANNFASRNSCFKCNEPRA